MSMAEAVRVELVGVVGLSAAGKSTAAHSLARDLRSPFHPIPLDDYFSAEACARLGTFDDYRTVDSVRFVQEVQQLKALLRTAEEEEPHADLQGRLAKELPCFLKYLVTTPSGQEVAEASEGVGRDGASDSDASDDSLAAHEREEVCLRASSAAAAARMAKDPRRGQCPVSAESASGGARGGGVVYVICEGFCLFCSDVVAKAALFDVCVWVLCPLEVACRRRFLRTPRRAKAATVSATGQGGAAIYKSRIELMWRTRTEERRQELWRVLTSRFDGAEEAEDDKASTLRLLSAGPDGLFFPIAGHPMVPPLWEPDTGAATDDGFAALWRHFRQRHHPVDGDARCGGPAPSSPPPPSSHDVYALFVQSAAAAPSSLPQGGDGGEDHCVDPDRARRYAEFRYWFYCEVAYYYCLFANLQRLHVRQCLRRQLVFSLENGGDVSRQEMDRRVAEMASQIVNASLATAAPVCAGD